MSPTGLFSRPRSAAILSIVLTFGVFSPPLESRAQLSSAVPDTAPGFTAADYPLDPGLLWRYRTDETPGIHSGEGPRTGLLEVRVLSHHRHGPIGVTALSRRWSGPDAVEEITFVVTSDSAAWSLTDPRRLRAVFAGDPDALDPARADLRFPLLAGKTWGIPLSVDQPDARYESEVGARENVAVPAGVFDCTPVRFRTRPDESTSWFKPGLGLVKYDYRHHGDRAGETWQLIEFRRDAVDTLAIGRAIDGVFDGILDQPGFWSRRSSVIWDPTLRALLGPITGGDGPDLDEGIRRLFVRGAGSNLIVEQLSNVPSWAYLVRWRGADRRVLHVYAREWEPITGGVLGPEVAPPLFPDRNAVTPAGRSLQSARSDFLRARGMVERGDVRRGAAIADSAMGTAVATLAGVLGASREDYSVSELRQSVRDAVGETFLTTRFGDRIRVDDGFVRIRMERGRNLIGIWAHLAGDGGTQYGPAPRVGVQSPEGYRTWALSGDVLSIEPRIVLDLDWSPGTPEPDVLVWSAGLPPLVPPSITLFRLEAAGPRSAWRRDAREGQVRLVNDGARLEITYTQMDSLNRAFRLSRREIYRAPAGGEDAPALIHSELLNPWVEAASRVVNALRSGRRFAAAPEVRGSDLMNRIGASWIADPRVTIELVEADPATINDLEGELLASVTLHRSAGRLPENPTPGALALRLTPDATGRWVVVDLVPQGPEELLRR